MSNANYNTTASGQGFAPLCQIQDAVTTQTTLFTYYNLVLTTENDLQVGKTGLIDDEIIQITAITDSVLTVKRGCFDTIPANHYEDSLIWIIDGFIGTDLVPYMGTEQIGVKLLPRTTSKVMDITYSPPLGLSMNQRMIRPYNVGQFSVNNSYWDLDPQLSAAHPNAQLQWNERNRVVQADQAVGHDDGGVAAEAGTTYHFHLYTAAGVAAHSYDNITTGWVYTRAMAVVDFGLLQFSDTGDYPIYGLFYTLRDGYTSWQAYRVDLRIDTTGLVTGLGTEDGQQLITENGINLISEQTQ